MLDRGDECEPHRLARDRHGGGVVVLCHDEGVGHRLDPRDLGPHVQVGDDRLACRAQVHRPGAPLPAAEHVEADVRRDAVEPRPQRRAPLEPLEAPPGADERLLDCVLRLERGREHPVAVRGQLPPVLLELTGDVVRGDAHGTHPRRMDRGPGFG